MTKLVVSVLSLIIAVAPLAAQTKAERLGAEEAMEFYSMPPDPNYIPTYSPRAIITYGPYTSYQINVDSLYRNIVNDAANEPTLVIDPTNPLRMAVGWRQFDSISSNFRQGGYAYSTDGGIHWTFPGVLEAGVFRSDPVLATTSGGIFHYNSLQDTFYSTEFRSTNWGQSWTSLGLSDGGDKQWITIDRTTSSGAGFVYQYWSTSGNNFGGRQFTRSTDGGSTWMNPINLPNTPIWGTMDVGPNGELYLVGTDGGNPSLRYLRSSNAKNGAVTPTFDQTVYVNMNGDLAYSLPAINPDGLGGQAWIAADRGANSPYRGNIYILASIDSSLGSNNRIDVKLRRSTNGGSSWQSVVMVNDDGSATGRYHWFGTLSVAPGGRVDACWLDTRNDSVNHYSQLYYSYSTDGGVTFKPNIALSPAFNSLIGFPQQNKIGDYMAMSSDDGGANIVYPATFNGEEDIYFVRVPQTATVSGNVDLQNLSVSPLNQTATIEFRTPGTTTVLYSKAITLDATGNYSATQVPFGTYDIAVKFSNWLRQVLPSVAVTTPTVTGQNFSLPNGDGYQDNKVDLLDLSTVLADFGMTGTPPIDGDVDWSGNVDLLDLSTVLANFGLFGTP